MTILKGEGPAEGMAVGASAMQIMDNEEEDRRGSSRFIGTPTYSTRAQSRGSQAATWLLNPPFSHL